MMKNGRQSGDDSSSGRPAIFDQDVQHHPRAQGDPDLAAQATAGVLRHAREGDLPLFAWTLGLHHNAWLTMLNRYFPALKALQPAAHAAIEKTTPEIFRQLAALLFDQRSKAVDAARADGLARVLAAACLGNRHLWMDLGLQGRADVSVLLSAWFPALHAKNVHNLKWKRFLFAELAAQRGIPEIVPPDCSRCDEFPICFPIAS